MTGLFPINVHAKDGKMIVSLAFKTESKARLLLDKYRDETMEGCFQITDDFGHCLIINYDTIGFMIYVDEELDNELGEYIAKKMSKAQEKARARDKIVKL